MSTPPTNREFTLVYDVDGTTNGRLTVFVDRYAQDPEPFFTVYQFPNGPIPIKLSRCDEKSAAGRVTGALASWGTAYSKLEIRRPETDWAALFPEVSQ